MMRSILWAGLGALVLLIAGVLSYFEFDKYQGRRAVEEMCQRDGGPKVSRTVNAKGYLDDTNTVGGVTGVLGPLTRQGFEYVDFSSKYAGSELIPVLKEPGYFRGSLRESSDASCIFDSRTTGRVRERFAGLEIPDGRCLAVERLSSRPKLYVYSRSFRNVNSVSGKKIGVIEQFIKLEESNEELAVNRDYIFTSKEHLWLDLSGGGGVIDASCPEANEFRLRSSRFIARVLRDSAK